MQTDLYFPKLWLKTNDECYSKVIAFDNAPFKDFIGVPITINILRLNRSIMTKFHCGKYVAEFSIANLDFTYCNELCHLVVDDIVIRQFTCVHELQLLLFAFGFDTYANNFRIFKDM